MEVKYTAQNGTEYYVLIVAHLDGTGSVYHVYRAAASSGLESASFTEVGSFEFEKDFQGFSLINLVTKEQPMKEFRALKALTIPLKQGNI